MRSRLALLLVALLAPTPSALAHDPSGSYRWVGDAEAPSRRDATLTHDVSSVWTADLQAVLTLDPQSLGGGTAAVSITPRNAESLAALPAGLFADGNAYEVTLAAGDTGLVPLDPPGRLDLAVPHDATTVLFSVDGEAWDVLLNAAHSPGHVGVPIGGEGLFLAATDHAVAATGDDDMQRAVVLVGAPAVLIALAVVSRRRRRAQEPEPVST